MRVLAALAALLLTFGTTSIATAEVDDDQLVNIAQLADTVVTASGYESGSSFTVDRAVDGDDGTDYATREAKWFAQDASRWSANKKEPPVWLAFDFGQPADIQQVNITWGRQFATKYKFEVSADGTTWQDVDGVYEGKFQDKVSSELNVTSRYLRMTTLGHRSEWPVSIWEIEVLGTVGESEQLPALVPLPASYEAADAGTFELTSTSDIVAAADMQAEAEKVAQILRASTGFDLPVVAESVDPAADIMFDTAEGLGEEGYTLKTTAQAATITASTTHGAFNGGRTMLQLLGPWALMTTPMAGPWQVPSVAIEDSPRFAYRGIMLDPARSFYTVDEVKQAIDVMSMYKFSYLHLHLTDDQGWRIEITNDGREDGDTIDYTRLTAVGGQTAMGPTDRNSKPGVTGFYTQNDLRDIVAYAADRHIAIVPEVDMPGHSQGILQAIPQLNTPGSSHDGTVGDDGQPITDPSQYVTAPPQNTSDVGESYLDPNSEYTWQFLRHVVGQVQGIVGGEYFHIGGDETHKMDQANPGAAVEFLREASAMVREFDVTPIGWNEWAPNGNVPQQGDVMQLWNGAKASFAAGLTASGGKAIFSHASNLYFPQKAGPGIWGATWACGGACGLEQFYNYDPEADMGLQPGQLLGIEGAMWNEHVRSIQDFFFPAFPRAMAAAEVGWTPQNLRTGRINNLRTRLADTMPALTVQGADFYAYGINHQPLVRAVAVPDGVVGYGYSPATPADGVSATVTFDGLEPMALTATSMRPYLPANDANNNNRAQAGLWEFALPDDAAAALPAGTHGGVITMVVGGDTDKAVSAQVTLVVAEDPENPGGPVDPEDPENPTPPQCEAMAGPVRPARATNLLGEATGDLLADMWSLSDDGAIHFYASRGAGMVHQGVVHCPDVDLAEITAIPDVNGDRRADLLAITADGDAFYYYSTGNGFLSKGAQVGHGWTSMDNVSFAGKLGNSSTNYVIARQKATGDLYRYQISGAGLSNGTKIGHGWLDMTVIVGTGQLTGDANSDVVAIRSDGKMFAYAGTFGGALVSAGQIGGGWEPFVNVTVPGDRDGNGLNDLIGVRDDGKLFFYKNTGTGYWGPATEVGHGWGRMVDLS
ncbi:family 20 glycosylhydrolase [Trueperella bernardiae]|uniref:family 20 glycosylhydrolase n=1 Tax=Trueperella bernardiae TaxID=59561 RepID=UPI00294AB93B|nr:family 20 glycosylhydrolase [Trueperella bernardiae]